MKTRDGTTANATVSEADERKLAPHFSKHMYQAVLQCTPASLDQVKRRIGVGVKEPRGLDARVDRLAVDVERAPERDLIKAQRQVRPGVGGDRAGGREELEEVHVRVGRAGRAATIDGLEPRLDSAVLGELQ